MAAHEGGCVVGHAPSPEALLVICSRPFSILPPQVHEALCVIYEKRVEQQAEALQSTQQWQHPYSAPPPQPQQPWQPPH
jgi:hypothetical protein